MSNFNLIRPLKVGVAGLGTVGIDTVRLLEENSDIIKKRCGRTIAVKCLSARSKNKTREIDLDKYVWFDNPLSMAKDDNLDVIVELIGGSEGISLDLAKLSLSLGKHFVTANKALIAEHGIELASIAEQKGLYLGYEAAVAAGIPIIKSLREGLIGNDISRVVGILNGTCNYILTRMSESSSSFDDVLKEAKQLGYAEDNPKFDIDGIDTSHKIAILSSIAFGSKLNIQNVYVEGIKKIQSIDFSYAQDLGYRIKLLGLSRKTKTGIYQSVHPCLIDESSSIASVSGSDNAIIVEGNFSGRSFLQGSGAGGMPTSSAVVADLADVAARKESYTFGVSVNDLIAFKPTPMGQWFGAWYIRITVADNPGVFAEIGSVFRDCEISMESILQRDHDQHGNVYVVIITHKINEIALNKAVSNLDQMQFVRETPQVIRIEDI